MRVQHAHRVASTLPADDAHIYRTGAWTPNVVEYDAWDLDVEGEIPPDLQGVYLRNTENPVHESIGLYHPFDGDGMLHAITFGGGEARYSNRFVRTDGFLAEQDEAKALWAGLMAMPTDSLREDGWGARGRMKDASSTDVVVHRGRAITSFWQCGELYAHDPSTLEPMGKEAWVPGFASPVGVSAHTKVDERTGEMLVFGYGKDAPHLWYGVVDGAGELVHQTAIELPGPRLPHDMAFTTNYAIFNNLPLFWDPEYLPMGVHMPKYFPHLPSRFGIMPRRGTGSDVKWFEGAPTYVLHWINAFEEGDEVVLDGFFQHNPEPAKDPNMSKMRSIYRSIDLDRLQARPHRWRFNMVTGEAKEESLSDTVMEFGMTSAKVAGMPYRYCYNATGAPGWFLFDGLVKHDLHTGTEERYVFGDGVFGSEAPFAPRAGAGPEAAEDDGYLVTFTTDVNHDRSDCLIFAASDVAAGPLAKVRLPERISSGTHSVWAGATALGNPSTLP